MDTQGLLLKGIMHSADIVDCHGAYQVLEAARDTQPRLKLIWVDMGYQAKHLRKWSEEELGWHLEVVRRPSKWGRYPIDVEPPPLEPGFKVLPRRWVVERSFAWMGRYRRLSKDYEYLIDTSETMMHLSMIRLMLKRLVGENVKYA